MMEHTCYIFIAIVAFDSIYGTTIPSPNTTSHTNKSNLLNQRSESPSVLNDKDSRQATVNRHKRWYDFYGFAPPLFDVPDNRIESPLTQIHRRLQEIANVGRQPPIPPPLQAIPLPLIPQIIYIDSFKCKCDGDDNKSKKSDNDNEIIPSEVPNRGPEVNDENKGDDLNRTDTGNEDVGRPISFDPIKLNITTDRPPPPVDHGTSQAGGLAEQPLPFIPEQAPQMPPDYYAPTACDGAVLSCCHQRKVTYECFVSQGCPDLSSIGNPCDFNVILGVISRFQTYYSQQAN